MNQNIHTLLNMTIDMFSTKEDSEIRDGPKVRDILDELETNESSN